MPVKEMLLIGCEKNVAVSRQPGAVRLLVERRTAPNRFVYFIDDVSIVTLSPAVPQAAGGLRETLRNRMVVKIAKKVMEKLFSGFVSLGSGGNLIGNMEKVTRRRVQKQLAARKS